MKLHLGCGSKILDGFVNVDIRQLNGVEVVEDISKLNSFEDNSVHLIYACHVLEHVSRLHRLDVLKRWHEVLTLEGVLRIAVPDFQKVVELYSNGVCLENLIGHLYGGQDYDYNFHCYCWDFESLKRDLESVGFSNVNRYDWRETEHSDVDDYSQAYWPHMEKETGLLVSLNVEAIK
ncbi:MAG: class I SAM-dependent methyltransferase [Promethearchaeota archaeon]|jgi:ubiquinone/menaquinone biosynthesis C-methylase UbiE